jgi:uncharacterized protein YcfL
MKKYIFLMLTCALLFVGCTTNTVIKYRTVSVTDNPVGTKIGQIDQTQGGILEAAKNGSITRISTVSKQNTDTYTTFYWPMLLGGSSYTVNTLHKEEIIVTGE